MNTKNHRRLVAIGLTVAVGLVATGAVYLGGATQAAAPKARVDERVDRRLQGAAATEMVTVIVRMRDRVDVRRPRTGDFKSRQKAVVAELRSKSDSTQRDVQALLRDRQKDGHVREFTSLWIDNSISVTAEPAVVRELGERQDIEVVQPDDAPIVPTGVAAPAAVTLADVALTGAPALWDLGFTGQGVTVANLDSGVDGTHPDLAGRYRGGANSWFDPYGQMAAPGDMSGHGTSTMGVMVAGSASGASLGMAPGATWIAARVFNNAGTATATAVHRALQWVLDPDNDPATADAPAIVNNSWAYGTPGCNLEFQPDVQALRAAGILPVFAAGNYGPAGSTAVSPANYPESLAVGSTDSTDGIDAMSSRGPSSCGGRSDSFPDLVAPGVDVLSTDLWGMYTTSSGSSIAVPKVSGALALLISATGAAPTAVEAALKGTAHDLGATGADDVYGRGRIDVAAAYQALVAGGTGPTTTTTVAPTTTTTVAPTTTTTVVGPADLVYTNGFESGTTSGWTSANTNGGRLSVSAAAARSGSYGLQATIANTTSMYVRDTTPTALATYHARFQFAPNGVTIASTRTHDLVQVLDASNNVVASVQIRSSSGSYQLRATGRTGTSTRSSSWFTVTNATHTIELAWSAATTTKGTNGSLVLWIDGSQQATVSSLANGAARVEEARVGPQAIGSGISGTEYFDGFVSTKGSYVGI